MRRRQPSEVAAFLSPDVQRGDARRVKRWSESLRTRPFLMLARFYKVYLPAFVDVPAILRCRSIAQRVGGHVVSVGGLILLSESTRPSVHELDLPPSARLRGDDLLKKKKKQNDVGGGDSSINMTTTKRPDYQAQL